MMTANDMNKMWTDMMGSFPVDTSAWKDAYRTQADLAEKMSRIVLDAAETSTDLSAQWTKDTISKMQGAVSVREEPAEYTKAMSDFASTQAEMTAETMARFAEIAKKVQTETVEAMLSVGKESADKATAFTKKAADDAAEMGRDVTRIRHLIRRAAAIDHFAPRFAPETHHHPDHLISLFNQQCGSDRAIDATAHGDDNTRARCGRWCVHVANRRAWLPNRQL